VPPLYDAVNLVFTPSNATFSVCEVPTPRPLIGTAMLLTASDADAASLMVFLSFFMT